MKGNSFIQAELNLVLYIAAPVSYLDFFGSQLSVLRLMIRVTSYYHKSPELPLSYTLHSHQDQAVECL